MQLHRMLPADVDIVDAELTVTRSADQYRARLTLSVRVLSRPAPVTDGPTIAVHMGWRHTGLGTQVATWRATEPLEIPRKWSAILHAGPDRTTGIIVLPETTTQRLDDADRMRADRDGDFNRVRERLAAWLTERGPLPNPAVGGQELTADEVGRWRSRAPLADVARAWTEKPPIGEDATDIVTAVTVWWRADRLVWQEQEDLRGRAQRHRDDVWANIAAVLAAQCGLVVLDDASIADIARRASDLPPEVATMVARRRVRASPGRLQAAIAAAFARRGVPTKVVPAAELSRKHEACATVNPPDNRYTKRPVRCDGCKKSYDPDESATVLMLSEARQGAA
ncbi:hypothetical protein [Nocardia sp. NBC_00403]|uniref:hypothetical protein n=1 Tax=Nocardia sp. NBC_00403 TaxID=2975990 RepID=UPI002E213B92